MGELSATGLKARLAAIIKDNFDKPVRIGAGGGLHLLVKPSQKPGTGAWVLRIVIDGKRRDMGLGTYPTIGLADARLAALAARSTVAKGQDPISIRQFAKAVEVKPKSMTFRAAAEACFASRVSTWKNPKHAAQWISTLEAHVFPKIGSRPVSDITVDDVHSVLKPIWSKIPETSTRIRGRIENVLSYAAASGFRPAGPNPAAWRGNLSELLGAPTKLKAAARRLNGRGENFSSLHYNEVPRFIEALETREGMAALALKFAILVAARTGEVRAMSWSELDLVSAVWVVPAAKMKAGKTHIVPLPLAALAIIEVLKPFQTDEKSIVFPSRRVERPLSDMALSMLVRGMCRDERSYNDRPTWTDHEGRPIVPHGFRASFKAWTLANGWPDHLSEKALAHSDRDKVRAAYARDPLVEERRPMMEAWAKWCRSFVSVDQ
jgi:integrase